MWIIWLVSVIVFAVIEMANASFFIIWFAIGSLGAMIASLFISSIAVQFFIFIIISTTLLLLTHKITKKFFHSKPIYKTNIDTVKNAQGIVIEEINNMKGTGQVKVKGEIWSALSASDEIIAMNASIIVSEVKGVKLVVNRDVTLD